MSNTLLIVGQAAQATGFARVTRAIADGLAAHFRVDVLAIDSPGPEDAHPAGRRYRIHHNPHVHDVFAERRLAELADQLRPDTILIYHDPWFIPRFITAARRARHRCPLIGYTPVDGKLLRPNVIDGLAQLDALVTYTEFARGILIDCARRRKLESALPFRRLEVIPHGVAEGEFFPIADATGCTRREVARRRLFPHRPDLWDGFWVLNANRNQPRKRIDLTLEGFARFARGKPENLRLYLHMEPGGYLNLRQAADRLSIGRRLILSSEADEHPAVDGDRLNLIYNACDLGVNTALGEGWGLVSLEHAATAAAQVVPGHSACGEIWRGAAELLPSQRKVHGNGLLQGGQIDPADLANALERLYRDSVLCAERQSACYQRAQRQEYQWRHICSRWARLLRSRMAENCAVS